MKICRECGEDTGIDRGICNACNNRKRGKGSCIDCGVPITKVCKRCKPCGYAAQSGPGNHNWTGGRIKTRQGYILTWAKDHPNAQATGRIFEHILVMSDYLGRPLESHENVHHKNGVKTDNRIENLELWSKSQPSGQRVIDKIAWAKEILALYEDSALEIGAV
jgi:hypothetical protein